MNKNEDITEILKGADGLFHPGFSIDCVIFGFHEGVLKVLLNKITGFHKWMLPGGFLYKNEDVDAAADRILQYRTGLKKIFLRQFHLFGDVNRITEEENRENMEHYDSSPEERAWIFQRFLTVGYYALVDFEKVKINTKRELDHSAWFEITQVPRLYADHNNIIEKALYTIRVQQRILPIGYELLPKKFTIPELRKLYEAFLGKELDRRNFQKKVLSLNFLKKLNEQRKGGAHKAPNLYQFDRRKYNKALEM